MYIGSEENVVWKLKGIQFLNLEYKIQRVQELWIIKKSIKAREYLNEK